MKCPHCHEIKNEITDTRLIKGGAVVRRRRRCLKCDTRFSTYEEWARELVKIIKKDGGKDPYDQEKLHRSLKLACAKRPVPASQINRMVKEITHAVEREYPKAWTSRELGELAASTLAQNDEIAYLRYVSIFRNFNHPEDFQGELQALRNRQAKEHSQ